MKSTKKLEAYLEKAAREGKLKVLRLSKKERQEYVDAAKETMKKIEQAKKYPPEKSMWVVASVSQKNGSRAWCFWDSLQAAIQCVHGWGGEGSFYSEDGYYTHVIIEEIKLNHPLTLSPDKKRKWFRLDYDPKTHKTPIVPCSEPRFWKRVVGFHDGVYPKYEPAKRFEIVDKLLLAIGFKECKGDYSFSHFSEYKEVPRLLRQMGYDAMAGQIEKREEKKNAWKKNLKKKRDAGGRSRTDNLPLQAPDS